nr:MAG: hypothetical protein 1 [Leviviridae sp.]
MTGIKDYLKSLLECYMSGSKTHYVTGVTPVISRQGGYIGGLLQRDDVGDAFLNTVSVAEVISSTNGRSHPNVCQHDVYPGVARPGYVLIPDHAVQLRTEEVVGTSGRRYTSVIGYDDYSSFAKGYWYTPTSSYDVRLYDLNMFEEAEKTSYTRLLAGGKSSLDVVASLVRSAFEMKDITTLPTDVRGLLAYAKKVGARDGASLSDLASAYLFYTYGISPTISDVKTLVGRLKSTYSKEVMPKLQKLQANVRSGKIGAYLKLREKLRIPPKSDLSINGLPSDLFVKSPQMFTRTWDNGAWVGEPHHLQVIRWIQSSFPALIGIRPLSGVTFAWFAVKQIMESGSGDLSSLILEATKLFQVSWEIFPLSFVIDWFFSVGDTFERVQNVWESFLLGLDPTFGIWTSKSFTWQVGIPEVKVLLPNVDYTLEPVSTDGITYYRLVVRGTYVFRPELPIFMENTGWKHYERHPIDYGAYDLLMPTLRVQLNASKLISLLAMFGG